MKLLLKNVRLAFPSIFEATAPKGGGKPAFSASFILPPGHPALKELESAFAALSKEKWGAKADAILKGMKASDKLCLHEGDTKADYEGYAGNYFVSTRSKTRPNVFDADRSVLSEADGKLYSGCYVNANIELWAQDNEFGKRINAQLRGVQFKADGDALAGGARPADADEFPDEIAADGGDDPAA